MRIFSALVLCVSLLPGCCVIGTELGGARAASHNDEVARKLERGEYVGPEDREDQSVDNARLTGFAVGALIDVAVAAVAYSMYQPHWGFGPTQVNED